MQQRQFIEWARKEQRRQTDLPAIAYRQDGSRLGVVMSDISYEGCQLSAPDEFVVGELVTIVVLKLGAEMVAEVKWTASGKSGALFVQS